MQKTKNYGFNKPESTDFYNVEDFNSAMDTVDDTLKKIEDGFDGKADQTAVDNIQTTSRATLSQAGWYRVAEIASHRWWYAPFEIEILKDNNSGQSANYFMRFEPNASGSPRFIPVSLISGNDRLVERIRITTDGVKSYIEVYYAKPSYSGVSGISDVSFVLNNAYSPLLKSAWKAITPTLTEETLDGVTVTCIYDIPSNASLVTDLDLKELVSGKSVTGSILDYAKTLEVGRYYVVGNSITDVPEGDNGTFEIEVKTKGYYITIDYSPRGINKTFTNTLNYSTWSGWEEFTTTADLANYFKNTGGTVNGKVVIEHYEPTPLTVTNNDDTIAVIQFDGIDRTLGSLGCNHNGPIYETRTGAIKTLIHSGNIMDYAFSSSGGTIDGDVTIKMPSGEPLSILCDDDTEAWINFSGYDGALGNLGFSSTGVPAFYYYDGTRYQYRYFHHDGNSAKLRISDTPLTEDGVIRVW